MNHDQTATRSIRFTQGPTELASFRQGGYRVAVALGSFRQRAAAVGSTALASFRQAANAVVEVLASFRQGVCRVVALASFRQESRRVVVICLPTPSGRGAGGEGRHATSDDRLSHELTSQVRRYSSPQPSPRGSGDRKSHAFSASSRIGSVLASFCLFSGCGHSGDSAASRIVVYSSLDPEFSEPVLNDYSRKSRIDIVPKFDTESTKSVGLTELIIQEAAHPRCDLFWNNEILNTLRLQRKGLLATWSPANAADIPDGFKSKSGTWFGFAARARVLLVNKNLVPEADHPRGLADLLNPRWKGKVAIAKPLFGTTATHATCLFLAWGDEKAKKFFDDLKANDVQVLSGNKQVATAVSSGQVAIGLTDTDDAIGEVAQNFPVALIYPDREPGELGTLFIPNTLAIPKGAQHPQAAAALGNALLSPEVEATLARGPSAQIPLNRKTQGPVRVETPQTIHAMPIDFEAASLLWDRVYAYLKVEFAGR